MCSKHFTKECYDANSQVRKKLLPGAVPSVFPSFPSYLQEKSASNRKARAKVSNRERTSSEMCDRVTELSTHDVDNRDRQNTPVKSVPLCEPDDTPRKVALKRKLEFSENKLINSRKKIKSLQQAKRRLTKKNHDLKSVLNSLQKKKNDERQLLRND